MDILTKTTLMASIAAKQTRELFHHSVHGIFDVSAMRGAALERNKPLLTANVSEELIVWLYDTRKINDRRVMELTQKQILQPYLAVEFADESDLLIDGAHRIIAGWMHYGFDTFKYWRFTEREIIRPVVGRVSTVPMVWGKFDILNNGDIKLYDAE